MSEIRERFDVSTYESAKRQLNEVHAGDSAGLDAIIEGQKKARALGEKEAGSRANDAAEATALLESLGAPTQQKTVTTPGATLSPQTTVRVSNTPTPPAHVPAQQKTVTTPGAVPVRIPNAPTPIAQVNPLSAAPERQQVLSPEQQLQNVKNTLAKMSFQLNGEAVKFDVNTLQIDRQANGSFKITHPELKHVTQTPILIDTQGNFITKSITIEKSFAAGFSSTARSLNNGDRYELSQNSGKVLIAKR